jgi:hypothetical protein
MKCISVSIPYHGIFVDAGGPVGGPITSTTWNGDVSPTPYERYTTWGGDGPYGINTTFVWKEKIDIRGLTRNMEKTVFPDHVTYDRGFPTSQVEVNPQEWIDTLILSRTPIDDTDLERITFDEQGRGGGIIPGQHGSDTDASDVIWFSQTLMGNQTVSYTTPLTQDYFHDGGRFQPLASESIWVYRVVQTRWSALGAMSDGTALIPACNIYLHVDADKEDVIPYLSRLAMSMKTIR